MAARRIANRVMPLHLKKPRQVKRKSRKSETMRSRTAARDQRSRNLSGWVTDMANQPLIPPLTFANVRTAHWLPVEVKLSTGLQRCGTDGTFALHSCPQWLGRYRAPPADRLDSA